MDPSAFCVSFLIPNNIVIIVRPFNKFRNFLKKFEYAYIKSSSLIILLINLCNKYAPI